MMSDVCKHCSPAPCLEACPTGASSGPSSILLWCNRISATAAATACLPALRSHRRQRRRRQGAQVHLCYDRLRAGQSPPAPRPALRTPSSLARWRSWSSAPDRVDGLHRQGVENAYLHGARGSPGATGGLQRLNAFFLLTDEPEVYNLPLRPSRPASRAAPSMAAGLATAAGLMAAAAFLFTRGHDHE